MYIESIAEERGIPTGPVFDVNASLDNPQVKARNAVSEIGHFEYGPVPVIEHPLRFDRAGNGFELPTPLLGEHHREILQKLEYLDDNIDDMMESGVFGERGDFAE